MVRISYLKCGIDKKNGRKIVTSTELSDRCRTKVYLILTDTILI